MHPIWLNDECNNIYLFEMYLYMYLIMTNWTTAYHRLGFSAMTPVSSGADTDYSFKMQLKRKKTNRTQKKKEVKAIVP